ncbi:dipeptidase [Lacinutrix sp. Bg11-31]|uniref:dipeptidase n=1 Tax=Lacinutrix sp. Bg11-31 TaxID=2057808 RepID=UPI000C312913|nr:dipeptidase [Lacinutrix sp. Bg11-31]AUC81496.1 peptidase M19 [Lacinutrix sp. Bg11-31]
MKSIVISFCIATLLFSCKTETKLETEEQLLARAKAIHERVITLDTHCDINVKNFTDSINYTQELSTQITLPKMKSGGLDVAWLIVYTGQDSLTDTGYAKAYENAMAKFDAIHKLTKEIAPNDIELAVSSSDVERIIKSGKKAAMIGIENGYPIGLDIKNVEKFYNLGARYMSLSHNGHSQLCDSNTGEEKDDWLHDGLSDLGKEVVVEMNRLGMMIDVSHPSKEAMRQMIELSKAPIIASHSSARALCNHSRNLDDEQLEWLKENGGVVQTVAFDSYLSEKKQEIYQKALMALSAKIADSLYNNGDKSYNGQWYIEDNWKKLTKEEQQKIKDSGIIDRLMKITNTKAEQIPDFPEQVNVSDFVNHIDYLVEKMGIDHVGISSDFDGGGGIEGWSDASETFNVTLELVKRGYTEPDIEQLWSGNLLRVLDDVEAVAEEMK